MDVLHITRYPVTIDGETAEIGTAAELAVMLDVLQGEHDREVLTQIAKYLPNIIRTEKELLNILRALAPDDQFFVVNTLSEHLEHIIGSSSELRDIFAMLSDDAVEEALLRQLGGTALRTLADSPAALADLLEWIYGDTDQLLLGLLGDEHLADLFGSGSELSLVLAMLSHPLQEDLIRLLGWDAIIEMIHTLDDFTALLGVLPPEFSRALIAQVPVERLRKLVRSRLAWQRLEISLKPREREYLRAKLGGAYAE